VIGPSVNQRHHSCVLWEIPKAEHFKTTTVGAGAEKREGERDDQQKRHAAREVRAGHKQAGWIDLSRADGDTHQSAVPVAWMPASVATSIRVAASGTGWRPVMRA
jgi:hypothetical protein